MTDVDLLVREVLEPEVPYRGEAQPDWGDVLRRTRVQDAGNGAATRVPTGRPAGRRAWSRRRLAVLLAAIATAAVAAVATPLGAAVARTIGDFSSWLAGAPGVPASEEEQRVFDEENRRSWAAFPDTPDLRRLIERRIGGTKYVLFGYRTGDSLCLRLTATPPVLLGGPGFWRAATSCSPLRELRTAEAPALVLQADYALGYRLAPTSRGRPRVESEVYATFGIAADGVGAIEVSTNQGETYEAEVANNAFLFLAPRPPRAFRLRSLRAVAADGTRTALPFAPSPFGEAGAAPATDGQPTGPSVVERRVRGGRIGWIERREERGQSLAEAGIDASQISFGPDGELLFARVIAPDPRSLFRVIFAVARFAPEAGLRPGGEMICTYLVTRSGAGGGCSPVGQSFPRGPLNIGSFGEHGGNQHVVFSGAASDEVGRIDLHLATGERVPAPLRDNAFAIEVARTSFPVRFVAYDRQGRVIGIETQRDDLFVNRGPRPVAGKQRVVLRVTGPAGTRATLRVGPSTDGGRCSRYSFSTGGGGGGCPPKESEAPPPVSLGVDPTGNDLFVTGSVSEHVRTIELLFEDGSMETATPAAGFVLWAVPAERLREGHRLIAAVGRDASGAVLGRYSFRIPPALYDQLRQ